MKTRNHFFALCCLFLLGTGLSAQGLQPAAWSVAVTHSAAALPGQSFLSGSLHPGGMIGREFNWKTKGNFAWIPEARLGFYSHLPIQNAVFLDAGLNGRQQWPFGLQVEGNVRLGYMHSFYPGKLYRQTDSGDWEASRGWGRPAATLSAGLGAGWRFGQEGPFSVFARYEAQMQSPYANSIPVLPHTLLSLGLRFTPYSK